MKLWIIERLFWRPKPPMVSLDPAEHRWYKLKNRVSTWWDVFRRNP